MIHCILLRPAEIFRDHSNRFQIACRYMGHNIDQRKANLETHDCELRLLLQLTGKCFGRMIFTETKHHEFLRLDTRTSTR